MANEIITPAERTLTDPAQHQSLDTQPEPVEESSFADALSEFERSHTHRAESKQLQGTVVSLTADQVVLDVGYKIEGVLPRSTCFQFPSPPATKKATTNSLAIVSRSPAIGPPSSVPAQKKLPSPALSPLSSRAASAWMSVSA